MPYSEDTGPRDVVANINYFAADGTTRQPGIFKKPIHGLRAEHARWMTIHDIRPIVNHFTIDANGFQFIKLPSKKRHVQNDEVIKHEYYPELSVIVKSMYGLLFNPKAALGLT